jgi:purine-nucleoside phosphorylase
VIAFTGRIHFFEGYRSMYHNFIGFIASFLGCQLLISTNSCGSMNPDLRIGDFMLISDHMNLSHRPFMNGMYLRIFLITYSLAPLLDDRFRSGAHANYTFSATQVHNQEMIALAKQCAKEVGFDLVDGLYAYWPLPQFESVADI